MAILIKFTSNEQFFIKQVLKKARAYAGYMNWRYDSERNYWCIFHVFFSPKSGFFYIEKWPVFGSDKFIIKVIHRSGKYGDLPHDEDKEIASFHLITEKIPKRP